MNFGTNESKPYHGFQHAGHITMKNCTLNGLFFSYGDMTFDCCTFNATGTGYSMWCYAGNITYTNCTVNCAGKFANVYNEGNGGTGVINLTVDGCTFNSTKVNKAAVNVKDTCGAKHLPFNVTIKNSTTNENFPAVSKTEKTWVLDPLVQVDDISMSGDSLVKVTLGDTLVFDNAILHQ